MLGSFNKWALLTATQWPSSHHPAGWSPSSDAQIHTRTADLWLTEEHPSRPVSAQQLLRSSFASALIHHLDATFRLASFYEGWFQLLLALWLSAGGHDATRTASAGLWFLLSRQTCVGSNSCLLMYFKIKKEVTKKKPHLSAWEKSSSVKSKCWRLEDASSHPN